MIVQTTKAEQDASVAATLAEQKLKVTQTQLEAAKDKASAIVAKAQADADVIRFNNKAELAGLASRVAAFDGDGSALAQNILVGKLAPGFRSILTNSEGPLDGPLRPVRQDLEGRSVPPRRPLDAGPDVAEVARVARDPRSLRRRPSHEQLESGAASPRSRSASWLFTWSATSGSGSGASAGSRSRPARASCSATGAVPVRARQGRQGPTGRW